MYDITIVGSGVSGIFLAYTLLQTDIKFKASEVWVGQRGSLITLMILVAI